MSHRTSRLLPNSIISHHNLAYNGIQALRAIAIKNDDNCGLSQATEKNDITQQRKIR